MGIQVGYGDDVAFRSLVYGVEKSPGTLQFMNNTIDNISNTLTTSGQEFFANTRAIYDEFNGSRAMHLAKAALNKINNAFVRTDIHEIWDLSKLQNAPPVMQRFILAEPTVRQMYNQQRCSGYSDSYVDMNPGTVGNDHYDYRRVMNGMVIESPTGGEMVTHYFDEIPEGDRELRHEEKEAILSTWEHVAFLMNYGGNDPTDQFNGKL